MKWNEESADESIYIVALCLFVDENTLFNVVPKKTWEHRKTFLPSTRTHIHIYINVSSQITRVRCLPTNIPNMYCIYFLLNRKKFFYAIKDTWYTQPSLDGFFRSSTHKFTLFGHDCWIHKRIFSINPSHYDDVIGLSHELPQHFSIEWNSTLTHMQATEQAYMLICILMQQTKCSAVEFKQ